ncbi:DUF4153 domain-containing protein [Patescibacteria group bacterium]
MQKSNICTRAEALWLLIISLAIGGVFTFLFYEKIPGISLPIFLAVFYTGIFVWSRKFIDFKNIIGWVMLGVIFALASTFAIYTSTLFTTLNYILLPLLIAGHTLIVTKKHGYSWSSFFFLGSMLRKLFGDAFGNIFVGLGKLRKQKDQSRGRKPSIAGKIIIGIVIAVPILITVVALLASADPVFSEALADIPETIFHAQFWGMFFTTVAVAFYALGFIYSGFKKIGEDKPKLQYQPPAQANYQATNNPTFQYNQYYGQYYSQSQPQPQAETQPKTQTEATPAANKGWDPIILATVLGALAIFYVIFAIIQFAYLFPGEAHVFLADFTYAEYAQKGFAELVIVTVINLIILLLAVKYVRQAKTKIVKIVNGLLAVLVACSGVILYSAHTRLFLYEQAYGLTYTRLFVNAFMILLLAFLVIAFVKIWSKKMAVKKAFILATIAVFILINFVNFDSLIAKVNVDRYYALGQNAEKIDVQYLTGLSYDAIPALVELKKSGNLQPEQVKMINDHFEQVGFEIASRQRYWQSFNLSAERAWQALQSDEEFTQMIKPYNHFFEVGCYVKKPGFIDEINDIHYGEPREIICPVPKIEKFDCNKLTTLPPKADTFDPQQAMIVCETDDEPWVPIFSDQSYYREVRNYIVYKDGEYQHIDTREKFRELYAPIESGEEAYSYAYALHHRPKTEFETFGDIDMKETDIGFKFKGLSYDYFVEKNGDVRQVTRSDQGYPVSDGDNSTVQLGEQHNKTVQLAANSKATVQYFDSQAMIKADKVTLAYQPANFRNTTGTIDLANLASEGEEYVRFDVEIKNTSDEDFGFFDVRFKLGTNSEKSLLNSYDFRNLAEADSLDEVRTIKPGQTVTGAVYFIVQEGTDFDELRLSYDEYRGQLGGDKEIPLNKQ